MSQKEIIRFIRVTKAYNTGAHVLKAVDDISFSIREGEIVVIHFFINNLFTPRMAPGDHDA